MTDFTTTKEAAEYLQVSVDDVRAYIKLKELRATKVPVKGRLEWRIDVASVEEIGFLWRRGPFDDWLLAKQSQADLRAKIDDASGEALRLSAASPLARETLACIAGDENAPAGARVQAAQRLLDATPVSPENEALFRELDDIDDTIATLEAEIAAELANPLVIEEGTFYRTRGGQKVGPLVEVDPDTDPPLAFDAWSDGDDTWDADGRHCDVDACDRHIVAEWDEQSVTRSIPEVVQDLAATEAPDIGSTISGEADVKAEIADEAKRIVSGARRAAYGTPESNFERIARFWQAYLENTGRGDVKITARDVSPMMRLMKEARLCETPDHRDSFVDLVGYTLTGAEVNGVQPLTADKPQA